MAAEVIPDAFSCFHCGLPIPKGFNLRAHVLGEERPMCCIGCCAVAEIFEAQGLSDWYLRREAATGLPAVELPDVLEGVAYLESPEFEENLIEQVAEGVTRGSVLVEGLTCAACVWVIERHLLAVDGISSVRVGLVSRRVTVEWDPDRLGLREIILRLAEIGFAARPDSRTNAMTLERSENRSALIRLGLAGLAAMNVMTYSVALYVGAFQGMEASSVAFMRWMLFLVSTPVVLVSARPFFLAAWREIRLARPGMDVPVALAIGGAYLISVYATLRGTGEVYFDSVCMFTFFLSLGRYLEMTARHRSTSLTRRMLDSRPLIARLDASDGERIIPAEALSVGDRFRVRPGEALPADGLVLEGHSAVEEALLTGEAWPRTIEVGDRVAAGSINVESPLLIEAMRVGRDTTLSSIVSLVERTQSERPKVAQLADVVASRFVTFVLAVAFFNYVAWQFIAPERAIWTTLAVLVATCPCALSLATPTAIAAATHALAKAGLIVTGSRVFEGLIGVDRVIFDKTGTLTRGRPMLARVVLRSSQSEFDVRRIAELLERDSEHPFAHALREDAGANPPNVEGHRMVSHSVPGFGIEGRVDGESFRIGRPTWASRQEEAPDFPEQASGEDLAWVLLADAKGAVAWFGFEDPIRVDAMKALDGLRDQHPNLKLEMLSGDPSPSAARVAGRLGLVNEHSGVTPEGKVLRVRDLQAKGECVVVVGDGLNDGPFLQSGDVSIAMGSGCDLSRLSADAVLVRDELSLVPLAISLSGRVRRVLYQNFGWAIAYNLCVLPFAVTGYLAPWLAALGMSASSLVVVLNALRLNRIPGSA